MGILYNGRRVGKHCLQTKPKRSMSVMQLGPEKGDDKMTERRLLKAWLVAAVAILITLSSSVQAGRPVIVLAEIDEYMTGQLKEARYPSLSIGIVRDQELILAKSYGVADRESGWPATTDSLYYIGSITKVLTTTLMCILRDQGRLRLDDPISKYLPTSVKLPTDPRGAPAITLRHLATHSSGLPRLPPNLTPKGDDVYGGYTVEQLYACLSQVELVSPIGADYLYSNLGGGLLGHLLERTAGEPYEQLLIRYLLDPLGMTNTRLKLSPQQGAHLTTGYKGDNLDEVASVWDLGCLSGAGDLVSSVTDMAKFLSLQLRAGEAGVKPVSGGTLTELHTPQRLAGGWETAVGLGWHITPAERLGDVVWHNGGTAGHFSFIGFVHKSKLGVVVLTNAGKQVDEIGWFLLAIVVESSKTPLTAEGDLPPAEKIIDNYIDATGGTAARLRVQNMVTRGKGTLAGLAVEYVEYNAAPARYYLKMTMDAATLMEQGTDGETVWEKELLGKAKIVTGEERDLVLLEAHLHRDVKWRELYKEAHCTGMDDVDGRRCYKVVMTPNSGPEKTRYYDAENQLLLAMETTIDVPPLGTQTLREVYHDYKAFDGICYPCRIAQKIAGIETTFTIESVVHNTQIPPERFEVPPAVRQQVKKTATTASRPATTTASNPANP